MRAVLVMVLAFVASAGRAAAQISPGPLARPHASLEGALNCANCHGLRREPMAQMCLQCHKDVAWLIERKRGLHARTTSETKNGCAGCHPDHAGADFALISWPDGAPSKFDHRRAGWALDGKHATVTCDKCHRAPFRTSPAAALSVRRSSPGWMGLETTCIGCHRADDRHTGSLGATCESCHDTHGWSPAPRFDHARTAYPLTGKHADVRCAECHEAPRVSPGRDARGAVIPVFKPVPSRDCSSCHTDPHRGRFTGACADCHVTRGFAVVDTREFNHGMTRYPLVGRHASVTCDKCHGTNLTNRNPPFATCGTCHADPHAGEATLAGKTVDCASCHTVTGFATATFSVAQHASTRFALAGKHAQVRCVACHTSASSARGTARVIRIRMTFARCADCHADPHGAQVRAVGNAGGGVTCESCHAVAGWKPSTFTTAAHARLRVPLSGRHATAGCAACHGADRPGLPPIPRPESLGSAHVLLAVPETECASCHADPHEGRYGGRGAASSSWTGGCASCHGTETFRPSTVDVAAHGGFGFALEGAHRAVPCAACHEEMKTPSRLTSSLVRRAQGLARLPFTPRRDPTCAGCHTSPHGTQFAARRDGGACDGCHTLDRFAPASRFDHERDASFSLRGAHARVPCASCHKPAPAAGSSTVPPAVAYRSLSTACESCHAGMTLGRTS